MEKKWWKSKSVLVGVLQAVGALSFAIAQEWEVAGILTLTSVLQIVLRVVTKTAIIK